MPGFTEAFGSAGARGRSRRVSGSVVSRVHRHEEIAHMAIPTVLLSAPLPLPFLNDPQPRGSFEDAMVRQFEKLATEIETRQASMELVLKKVTGTRDLSMQDLLALQIKVYKYSFEIDLLSK